MDFLLEFARKENAEVQTIDISDPNADLQSTDVLVFINIKDDLTDDEVNRALLERIRQFPGQERQVYDFYRNNPGMLAELRAPICSPSSRIDNP